MSSSSLTGIGKTSKTEDTLQKRILNWNKQITLEAEYSRIKISLLRDTLNHSKQKQMAAVMSAYRSSVLNLHDIDDAPLMVLLESLHSTHPSVEKSFQDTKDKLEIIELELMSEAGRSFGKQTFPPEIDLKLKNIYDQLKAFRDCKKHIFDAFSKLKLLELDEMGQAYEAYAKTVKSQKKLETKLKSTEEKYIALNTEHSHNLLKERNREVKMLKQEVQKKSREIHLSYTYKKRYNEIVNNNNNGSNYPRARTSATQEVTIGNVLDYLDRVVNEKNELKEKVKTFKKNVARGTIYNFKHW